MTQGAHVIYILPLIVGVAAIIQGGMNKQISNSWGLGPVVYLNAVVFFAASAVMAVMYRYFPQNTPEFLRSRGGSEWSWWYVIPGLAGLAIVVLTPFAIEKIGAFKVFLGLIGAQLVGSLVWDAYVEGLAVTRFRIIGAIISFACALLVGIKA
jgi:uncharacterized membrane protein YdcZ (DUF606 family)